MFEISVKLEADRFRRGLSDLEKRQAPFAIALGLTRTAQDVRGATIARMGRVLDRPTRFTLNAFRVTPATKQSFEATVGFRALSATGAKSYLEPLEFGGPRPAKRFETILRKAGIMRANEFAVPAKTAKLNRYGNVPSARLVQILSQLKAFNSAGFDANETARSRKRAAKTRARYFAITSNGRELQRTRGLPPGIYQRRGRGARDAEAIFVFVKQPTYRAILGFRTTAKTTTANRLSANMRDALDQAIASANLKGAS